MSRWFLLSTALLLQSINLYHRSSVIIVQASRHPWTKTDIHHHPTIIKTHNNVVETTTNNNYSPSVFRLLILRAGDTSSDDESTTNNPRRRRKRKRVRVDPPTSTDVEGKGEEVNVDDAVGESTQQPQTDAEAEQPAEKKGKKRRRRLFSRNKKENDNVEPSTDVGIDNQEEDVAIPSSNAETGKRIKKRRRKKVVDQTVDVDLEKEMEVEESVLSGNEDVGVEEDSIPEAGEVAVADEVTDGLPVDENEVDNNMEVKKSATRTKKRKKKKRATSTIVQDTHDEVTDEEITEAIDAEPLPPLPVETPNEEVNKTKKRKKKKRRADTFFQDSIDVDKEEKTSEAIDASQVSSVEIAAEETTTKKRKRKRRVTGKTVQEASGDVTNEEETTIEVIDTSPQLSIDASVEIPSEEIVPESIGSSIEVDESLKVTPMEDEEVEDLSSEVIVDSIEKEVKPASDDVDSITSIDDKGGDDEYIVEPTEEVPAEAENEEAEELSSEDAVRCIDEEMEPASDDGTSITVIDASIDKESDDENIVESTDEVPAEAENEEADELPSEDVVDSVEEEAEPVLDDETSITIIDDKESNDEHIVTPTEEVPAAAEDEEVKEMPSEDYESADDRVEPLVNNDASVEIPREEIVQETGDASIEVEEDFRAEAIEEAEEGSDGMNAIINGEEEEEGGDDEEGQQESNADFSSDGNESETAALPFVEGDESVQENPTSVEEVATKDTDDEITRDVDGDASDKIEENEEIEQSSSQEVSETSQPIDLFIEPESPENEVEGVVSLAETNEEENIAVEEMSSAQLDQSNIDTDDIIEGQTNIIELEKMEDDCLTISVVTWNLAEDSFSEKEASFFKKFRKGNSKNGSDLVLIGAQECEDIKPRRSEGHRSRHLRRVGIQMLGKDYVPLAMHSLGGIQMALYCHRDVLGDVEMVNIADVTCGVGNVFHNKGAIGVYLKMKRLQKNGVAKSSRMLFVTGHLAAHVHNVDARNDDFKRIISGLEAQAPARFLRPNRNPDGSPSECDGSYLLKSMDHIFFAGDLNYRVDFPREYVERCIIDIKENQSCERLEEVDALMNKLLRRDQLLQTIASGRAFPQFNEGKITFLPTFKFDKGTQNYDTSHKQRVPAWTDRILFRSSKVNVLEYQSVPAAMHSDHRPVFGTYRLVGV